MHLSTRAGCLSPIHICATVCCFPLKPIKTPYCAHTLSLLVYPHLSLLPALNPSSLITSINNFNPLPLPSPGTVISLVSTERKFKTKSRSVCLWHIPLPAQSTGPSFSGTWHCHAVHRGFHSIVSNLHLPSLG